MDDNSKKNFWVKYQANNGDFGASVTKINQYGTYSVDGGMKDPIRFATRAGAQAMVTALNDACPPVNGKFVVVEDVHPEYARAEKEIAAYITTTFPALAKDILAGKARKEGC